jgi:hydroxyethylthiazole kinase
MDAAAILESIRSRRPLVHCLTNGVTIQRVADALAAVGAAPVMASAPEEAADMSSHAQALLLNLGTPAHERFVAAAASGERARALGIPVVFDPVGCGSTPWRTERMRELAQHLGPSVVRGNAPEIAALASLPAPAALHGITADRTAASLQPLARDAARLLGCTVLVTGVRDVLADAQRVREYREAAAPVLGRVVGAGDVLSALVCACCAVEAEDTFGAAEAALVLFRTAIEQTHVEWHHPGSFWPALNDALASLRPADLLAGAR